MAVAREEGQTSAGGVGQSVGIYADSMLGYRIK